MVLAVGSIDGRPRRSRETADQDSGGRLFPRSPAEYIRESLSCLSSPRQDHQKGPSILNSLRQLAAASIETYSEQAPAPGKAERRIRDLAYQRLANRFDGLSGGILRRNPSWENPLVIEVDRRSG